MEKLPNDILSEIALKLEFEELFKFCLTNKRFNRVIYNSQPFWFRKFHKDFPIFVKLYLDLNVNAKQRYLEIFHKISIHTEKMVNEVLIKIQNISKYLSSEYRKDLHKFLFNMLSQVRKPISYDNFYLDISKYIEIFQSNFIPIIGQDRKNGDYYWGDFIFENIEFFIKFINKID